MTPQQYRPIIIKTLKDGTSKKYASVEEFADRLIQRMEDYEEMVGMITGAGGVLMQTSQAEAPATVTSNIILPGGDVSERIRPVAQADQVALGLKENFTKDQLYEYYFNSLPPQITVKPEGFKEPLNLMRFVKKAPGDAGFIRMGYAPAGANQDVESVQEVAATTDSKLDAGRVLTALTQQAQVRFRATRNRVEPVRPPMIESLEAGLSGAPSLETDEKASAEDMASWGGMSAGKAANEWEQQRK